MPGRARLAAGILLTSIAGGAFAQSAGAPSTPFESGRAALAAHDPTTAIAHFEQVAAREGREWLAVALMMESRSPSDDYVERAFEAAGRARIDQADRLRPRKDLAASLRPGDLVIAFLVGDTYAYAWAFDRDSLVGYPLPPSAELATAATTARAYIDRNDQSGVQRIAEQLMPDLLGPAEERVSRLTRVIFVTDGPLQRLPITELARTEFPPGLAIVTADYSSLADTVMHAQFEPDSSSRGPQLPWLSIGVVLVIVLITAVAVMRRR